MNSKLVDRTLSYMATGIGAVPVRIFFSLSSEPLRFRTFGDKPTDGGDLNDKHFDKFFSGSYLITIVAAGVANKVLHAAGRKFLSRRRRQKFPRLHVRNLHQ